MRNRLIELLRQIDFDFSEESVCASEDGYKGAPDFAEFFADHLLAEGVIVPPCKVGQTVYAVSNYYGGEWRIYECRVDNFTAYKTNIFMSISDREGYNFGANICEIGKMVFLTREEAEMKLKENSNACNN